MPRNLVHFTFRKAVDWYFRVKAIERFMFMGAITVLIAVFGGNWLVPLIFDLTVGSILEEYGVSLQTVYKVQVWILIICGFVIVVSIAISIWRLNSEARSNSRKRVIVIEGRGLRDDDGLPLADAIPENIVGQRIPILLDLRNRFDGKVINPEQAIMRIQANYRSIIQHRESLDRKDLTTIYGGLTSVPYTFLTGIYLDDEGSIVTFDWDRTKNAWRTLEGDDDGKRFIVSGFDAASNQSEIVIAISYSYPIASEDLASTFSCPVVRLTLDGMSSDSHWSEEKQSRLAQQFLEIVKQLSANRVKTIRLVMAAPNSVVLNFGRRYDKRNLPLVIVYQFERDQIPAYPWGIKMPVGGAVEPTVIYSNCHFKSES